MNAAFVALGSNLGDRAAHLARAVEGLARLPSTRVAAVSSWIETDAVGGPPGQPRYLNGVARIETELAPRALLDRLLAIERGAGRERVGGVRDAPRTLDLDLLLYAEVAVAAPGLVVPHPRMEERLFVLRPLAELAPGLLLPSGRRIEERIVELEAPRPRLRRSAS